MIQYFINQLLMSFSLYTHNNEVGKNVVTVKQFLWITILMFALYCTFQLSLQFYDTLSTILLQYNTSLELGFQYYSFQNHLPLSNFFISKSLHYLHNYLLYFKLFLEENRKCFYFYTL